MRKTVTALVAAMLGVLALASPAHADPANSGVFGTTFVDGADTLTDDWGDQQAELGGALCNGCAHSFNTDIVVMWQSVLAAEGLLSIGGIDGQYGPVTAAATRTWQGRYGVGVDGRVGNQTWSRADDFLLWVRSGDSELVYIGVNGGKVGFVRGDEDRAHDNGAYELVYVVAPGGVNNRVFFGSRVQYSALTVF